MGYTVHRTSADVYCCQTCNNAVRVLTFRHLMYFYNNKKVFKYMKIKVFANTLIYTDIHFNTDIYFNTAQLCQYNIINPTRAVGVNAIVVFKFVN